MIPNYILEYHIIPFLFAPCDHCKRLVHRDHLNQHIMLFTRCLREDNIFDITLCDFCLINIYLKYYNLYSI